MEGGVERDLKGGTLFVVMGLAWFLSQLRMKSALTDSHLLHSYSMFKSWGSAALLPTQFTHCCQTHFKHPLSPSARTHYTTSKNVPRDYSFLECDSKATNLMSVAFLCLCSQCQIVSECRVRIKVCCYLLYMLKVIVWKSCISHKPCEHRLASAQLFSLTMNMYAV